WAFQSICFLRRGRRSLVSHCVVRPRARWLGQVVLGGGGRVGQGGRGGPGGRGQTFLNSSDCGQYYSRKIRRADSKRTPANSLEPEKVGRGRASLARPREVTCPNEDSQFRHPHLSVRRASARGMRQRARRVG